MVWGANVGIEFWGGLCQTGKFEGAGQAPLRESCLQAQPPKCACWSFFVTNQQHQGITQHCWHQALDHCTAPWPFRREPTLCTYVQQPRPRHNSHPGTQQQQQQPHSHSPPQRAQRCPPDAVHSLTAPAWRAWHSSTATHHSRRTSHTVMVLLLLLTASLSPTRLHATSRLLPPPPVS